MRYMTPTLEAALLISSRGVTDPGLLSDISPKKVVFIPMVMSAFHNYVMHSVE